VTVAPEGGRYTAARRVWREEHLDVDPQHTWDACRDGLIEAARWAGEAGVTLALQNHAPVTNSPADVLRMIREVASPHLKACLDAPMAARQGVASGAPMRQAALDVRGLQVLSHFGGEYERQPDGSVRGFDREPDMTLTPEGYYADFVQGMREIGYEGYIGYELCHPLPEVDGAAPGIDFADKNAQLAAEYMRALIGTSERALSAPRR
jgi:sugar phosphate isomerase/epimerase